MRSIKNINIRRITNKKKNFFSQKFITKKLLKNVVFNNDGIFFYFFGFDGKSLSKLNLFGLQNNCKVSFIKKFQILDYKITLSKLIFIPLCNLDLSQVSFHFLPLFIKSGSNIIATKVYNKIFDSSFFSINLTLAEKQNKLILTKQTLGATFFKINYVSILNSFNSGSNLRNSVLNSLLNLTKIINILKQKKCQQ